MPNYWMKVTEVMTPSFKINAHNFKLRRGLSYHGSSFHCNCPNSTLAERFFFLIVHSTLKMYCFYNSSTKKGSSLPTHWAVLSSLHFQQSVQFEACDWIPKYHKLLPIIEFFIYFLSLFILPAYTKNWVELQ